MKRTIYYRLMLFCAAAVLVALFCVQPHKVYAKEVDAKKEGTVIKIGKNKKTVETLEGSFVKKKGNKYFKGKKGKLIKSRFFSKGGDIYYADGKGIISLGWKSIKGHYYFFDRKSGKMIRNEKIDDINITKDGIAKESKRNVARIKAYLEAQKVVQAVSKPSDSKSKKLYKAYRWMEKFPYRQYRSMRTAKKKYPDNWDVVFANDIFQKHKGCCASEACAFAFIAKVCGYDKVTICTDDNKLVHVWVDIGGRLYDPLFAESRGFKKNYNAKYTDDRKHPAYTKKL